MLAQLFRFEYDAIKVISSVFASQAEAIAQMNQNLKSNQEVLDNGDWIGEGQKKFKAEMDDQIMRSLTRLHRSLEHASQITKQMDQLIHQHEQEASGIMKVLTSG